MLSNQTTHSHKPRQFLQSVCDLNCQSRRSKEECIHFIFVWHTEHEHRRLPKHEFQLLSKWSIRTYQYVDRLKVMLPIRTDLSLPWKIWNVHSHCWADQLSGVNNLKQDNLPPMSHTLSLISPDWTVFMLNPCKHKAKWRNFSQINKTKSLRMKVVPV